MMKYTKTAIGLLTRQYRSVLKKCWLINVGLFALGAPIMAAMTASDANAAIDAIALNGTTYTSGTAILPTLIESITVNGTTYSGQKAFDMGTLVKSIAFNAGSGVNYVNGAATIGISSANGQITIGGQTIDLGGVLKTTGTTNQTVAGDVKFGSITLGTDSLSSVGTDVIALTNTETTKVATTGAVAKTVKANTVNADYTTLGDGVIGTSGTKVAVGGALDTLNTTLLAVQGTANSAVQDVKLSLNGNTAASIIDANKIANLSFNTGSTPGTIAIGTGGTTTTDVAVKDVLLTTGQTVQSVAGEVDVGSLKVGDSAKLTGTSTAAVGLTDTSVATLVTNKALADTVRTNAEGAKLTVTGSTGHSILVGADRTIGSAINILDQQVFTNQTDITTNKNNIGTMTALASGLPQNNLVAAINAVNTTADNAIQSISLVSGTNNATVDKAHNTITFTEGTTEGAFTVNGLSVPVHGVATLSGDNTFSGTNRFAKAQFGGSTAPVITTSDDGTNAVAAGGGVATTLASTKTVGTAIKSSSATGDYSSSTSYGSGTIGAAIKGVETTAGTAVQSVKLGLNGTTPVELKDSNKTATLTFATGSAAGKISVNGNDVAVKDAAITSGANTFTAANTFNGAVTATNGISTNTLKVGDATAPTVNGISGDTAIKMNSSADKATTLATVKALTNTVDTYAQDATFSPSTATTSLYGSGATIKSALNAVGEKALTNESAISGIQTNIGTMGDLATDANTLVGAINEVRGTAGSAVQKISFNEGAQYSANASGVVDIPVESNTAGTITIGDQTVAIKEVVTQGGAQTISGAKTFSNDLAITGSKKFILNGNDVSTIDTGANPTSLGTNGNGGSAITLATTKSLASTIYANAQNGAYTKGSSTTTIKAELDAINSSLTSDVVHTTGSKAETITGVKTFSDGFKLGGSTSAYPTATSIDAGTAAIPLSGGNGGSSNALATTKTVAKTIYDNSANASYLANGTYGTDTIGKALQTLTTTISNNDSAVVHKTGDETIAGAKTFNGAVVANAGLSTTALTATTSVTTPKLLLGASGSEAELTSVDSAGTTVADMKVVATKASVAANIKSQAEGADFTATGSDNYLSSGTISGAINSLGNQTKVIDNMIGATTVADLNTALGTENKSLVQVLKATKETAEGAVQSITIGTSTTKLTETDGNVAIAFESTAPGKLTLGDQTITLNDVVTNSTDDTITGAKTFSKLLTASNGLTVANGLTADSLTLGTSTAVTGTSGTATYAHSAGDAVTLATTASLAETVYNNSKDGTFTFTGETTPTTIAGALDTLKSSIGTNDGLVVHKAGAEDITGVKTFQAGLKLGTAEGTPTLTGAAVEKMALLNGEGNVNGDTSTVVTTKALADTVYNNAETAKFTPSGEVGSNVLRDADASSVNTISKAVNYLGTQTDGIKDTIGTADMGTSASTLTGAIAEVNTKAINAVQTVKFNGAELTEDASKAVDLRVAEGDTSGTIKIWDGNATSATPTEIKVHNVVTTDGGTSTAPQVFSGYNTFSNLVTANGGVTTTSVTADTSVSTPSLTLNGKELTSAVTIDSTDTNIIAKNKMVATQASVDRDIAADAVKGAYSKTATYDDNTIGSELQALAEEIGTNDDLVVHKADAETITGTKTFTAGIKLGAGDDARVLESADTDGTTGADNKIVATKASVAANIKDQAQNATFTATGTADDNVLKGASVDASTIAKAVNVLGTETFDIKDTMAGYGDIVTHNVAEFATSAQGALADSALQNIAVQKQTADATPATIDGTPINKSSANLVFKEGTESGAFNVNGLTIEVHDVVKNSTNDTISGIKTFENGLHIGTSSVLTSVDTVPAQPNNSKMVATKASVDRDIKADAKSGDFTFAEGGKVTADPVTIAGGLDALNSSLKGVDDSVVHKAGDTMTGKLIVGAGIKFGTGESDLTITKATDEALALKKSGGDINGDSNTLVTTKSMAGTIYNNAQTASFTPTGAAADNYLYGFTGSIADAINYLGTNTQSVNTMLGATSKTALNEALGTTGKTVVDVLKDAYDNAGDAVRSVKFNDAALTETDGAVNLKIASGDDSGTIKVWDGNAANPTYTQIAVTNVVTTDGGTAAQPQEVSGVKSFTSGLRLGAGTGENPSYIVTDIDYDGTNDTTKANSKIVATKASVDRDIKANAKDGAVTLAAGGQVAAGDTTIGAALNDLNSAMATVDGSVVHIDGAETITGAKTFSSAIAAEGGVTTPKVTLSGSELTSVDADGTTAADKKVVATKASVAANIKDQAEDADFTATGTDNILVDNEYATTIKGALNELGAQAYTNKEGISAINDTIGDTAMGTTASTLTGAIAEVNGKASSAVQSIKFNDAAALDGTAVSVAVTSEHAGMITIGGAEVAIKNALLTDGGQTIEAVDRFNSGIKLGSSESAPTLNNVATQKIALRKTVEDEEVTNGDVNTVVTTYAMADTIYSNAQNASFKFTGTGGQIAPSTDPITLGTALNDLNVALKNADDSAVHKAGDTMTGLLTANAGINASALEIQDNGTITTPSLTLSGSEVTSVDAISGNANSAIVATKASVDRDIKADAENADFTVTGTYQNNVLAGAESTAVDTIKEAVNYLGTEAMTTRKNIGDMTALTTTADNLVGAINEIKGTAGGAIQSITIGGSSTKLEEVDGNVDIAFESTAPGQLTVGNQTITLNDVVTASTDDTISGVKAFSNGLKLGDEVIAMTGTSSETIDLGTSDTPGGATNTLATTRALAKTVFNKAKEGTYKVGTVGLMGKDTVTTIEAALDTLNEGVKNVDDSVVHIAGPETITGAKTFSNADGLVVDNAVAGVNKKTTTIRGEGVETPSVSTAKVTLSSADLTSVDVVTGDDDSTKVATTASVARDVKAQAQNADFTAVGTDNVLFNNDDATTIKGALNELGAQAYTNKEGISAINDTIGDTAMGTTATTLTGAIAEVNGKASSAVQSIKFNDAAALDGTAVSVAVTSDHAGMITIGGAEVAIMNALLTDGGQTIEAVDRFNSGIKLGSSESAPTLNAVATQKIALLDGEGEVNGDVNTVVTTKALADTIYNNAQNASFKFTGTGGQIAPSTDPITLGTALNDLNVALKNADDSAVHKTGDTMSGLLTANAGINASALEIQDNGTVTTPSLTLSGSEVTSVDAISGNTDSAIVATKASVARDVKAQAQDADFTVDGTYQTNVLATVAATDVNTISKAVNVLGKEAMTTRNNIGNMEALETTADNLVGAINEIKGTAGGAIQSITIGGSSTKLEEVDGNVDIAFASTAPGQLTVGNQTITLNDVVTASTDDTISGIKAFSNGLKLGDEVIAMTGTSSETIDLGTSDTPGGATNTLATTRALAKTVFNKAKEGTYKVGTVGLMNKDTVTTIEAALDTLNEGVKNVDDSVVHIAGPETITGAKTFSNADGLVVDNAVSGVNKKTTTIRGEGIETPSVSAAKVTLSSADLTSVDVVTGDDDSTKVATKASVARDVKSQAQNADFTVSGSANILYENENATTIRGALNELGKQAYTNKTDISTINSTIGTAELLTNDQTLKGAINEVKGTADTAVQSIQFNDATALSGTAVSVAVTSDHSGMITIGGAEVAIKNALLTDGGQTIVDIDRFNSGIKLGSSESAPVLNAVATQKIALLDGEGEVNGDVNTVVTTKALADTIYSNAQNASFKFTGTGGQIAPSTDPITLGTALNDLNVALKNADDGAVHIAGPETITGAKTFSSTIVANGGMTVGENQTVTTPSLTLGGSEVTSVDAISGNANSAIVATKASVDRDIKADAEDADFTVDGTYQTNVLATVAATDVNTISKAVNVLGKEAMTTRNNIGNMEALETTAGNLVGAINEVKGTADGAVQSITIGGSSTKLEEVDGNVDIAFESTAPGQLTVGNQTITLNDVVTASTDDTISGIKTFSNGLKLGDEVIAMTGTSSETIDLGTSDTPGGETNTLATTRALAKTVFNKAKEGTYKVGTAGLMNKDTVTTIENALNVLNEGVKSVDDSVVHIDGPETITGAKTFSNADGVVVDNAALGEAKKTTIIRGEGVTTGKVVLSGADLTSVDVVTGDNNSTKVATKASVDRDIKANAEVADFTATGNVNTNILADGNPNDRNIAEAINFLGTNAKTTSDTIGVLADLPVGTHLKVYDPTAATPSTVSSNLKSLDSALIDAEGEISNIKTNITMTANGEYAKIANSVGTNLKALDDAIVAEEDARADADETLQDNIDTLDSLVVHKAGDTMTGKLTVSNAENGIEVNNAAETAADMKKTIIKGTGITTDGSISADTIAAVTSITAPSLVLGTAAEELIDVDTVAGEDYVAKNKIVATKASVEKAIADMGGDVDAKLGAITLNRGNLYSLDAFGVNGNTVAANLMELDKALGLIDQTIIKTDGVLPAGSPTHYVSGMTKDTQAMTLEKTSVADNLLALDAGLYQETLDRDEADVALQGAIDAEADAREDADDVLQGEINDEVTRAMGVEGELEDLTGNAEDAENLVEAINAVDDALADEIDRATTVEGDLEDLTGDAEDAGNLVAAINAVDDALIDEIDRATSVEGDLEDLTTSDKSSLVAAINSLDGAVDDKLGEITESHGNLNAVAPFSEDNTVADNLMKLDSAIGEVDQAAITNPDGTVSGGTTHYISGRTVDVAGDPARRTTVAENLTALDAALYQETLDRADADDELQGAIDDEIDRATSVEGELEDLTGNAEDAENLVEAINAVDDALADEIDRATSVEGDLDDLTGDAEDAENLVDAINLVDGALADEIDRATTVEGDLADLTGNAEGAENLVEAINAVDGAFDNKLGEITSSEGEHLTVAAFSEDNTVADNLMSLDSAIGKIQGLRKTDPNTGEQVIDPQGDTHYIYGVDRTYDPDEQPINRSVSVAENLLALDTALFDESERAKAVEGDLEGLETEDKTDLVSAINSEMSRAQGVEGDLDDLTTEDKSNLVAAINELQGQTGGYATKAEVHGDGAGTTVQLGDLADSTTIGQAKGIVSVDSVNGTISLNAQDEEGELTTGVTVDGNTQTVSIATSDEDGTIYGLTVDGANNTTTIGSDEDNQIVISEGDLSTTGKIEVGTDLAVAGKATFGEEDAQVKIEGGSIVVKNDVKAASLTLDNTVSKIDTGSVITSENAASDTLATTKTIHATVGDVKGMTGNNFLEDAVTVADQLQRLDAILGNFENVREDVAGADIVDVLNNLDIKIDESAGNVEEYVDRRFAGGYYDEETHEWVHEPIVLGNLASSITIGTEETGMVFDPEDKTVTIATVKDGVSTGISVEADEQKIVLGSSKASGKSFGITIDSDLNGDGDGSKVVIGDGEKDVTIADGKVTADAVEAESAVISDGLTVGDPNGANTTFDDAGAMTSTGANGETVTIADGTVSTSSTDDAGNISTTSMGDGKITSTVKEPIGDTGNYDTKTVEIGEGAVTASFTDGNGVVKEEITLDHGEIRATSKNRDDDMTGEVVISKGGVSAITQDADGNTIGEASMIDGNITASNSATIGQTDDEGNLTQGVQMKADGSIVSDDGEGNTVEIGSGNVVASNAMTAGTVDEEGNLVQGVQMNADGSIVSDDGEGNTVEIGSGEVVASNAVTAGTVDEEGELVEGVQMGADGSIVSKNEDGDTVEIGDGAVVASNAMTAGTVDEEGELVEGVQMGADGSITSKNEDGDTVEIADGAVVASDAVTAGTVDEEGELVEGVQIGADGSITSKNDEGEVEIADGNITASGKIDAAEIEVDDLVVDNGQFNESVTVGTADEEGNLEEGIQMKADGSFVSKNDEGETVEIADGNVTASDAVTAGTVDAESGELTEGAQMGADGTITSIDEDGKTVTIANGNIDALSGAFADSLQLGENIVEQIDTGTAPITSESYEDGSKVLATVESVNATVGDVATLGVGKEGTNLGTTGSETAADQLDALDDAIGNRTYEDANILTTGESVAESLKAADQAIGDVKQFAAGEYEGFAKDATNLSQAVAQVDAQVVTNTDHIGSMEFAEVPVSYGVGAITGDDLTEAVSQLSSNIGSGEVLDKIEKRTEVAENNGVSSGNTVNENIAAVNDTIGDLKNLSQELKNLTNGGENVPTSVVEAFNNLDATLGHIHGLAEYRGDEYKGNLAEGTTVEMHLSALDDAIGDRAKITNENGSNGYEFSSKEMYVADVLTDLASQIGTAQDLGKEVINGVSAQNTVNQNIAAVNSAIGNVSELEDTYFLSDTNNLTDAVKVLDEDLYQLTGAVNTTWRDLKELHHEVRRGMASMAAMSALVPNPRAHGKTSLSLGTGAYSGHGAVAVGGFHNITDNLMLNAGLAWSNSKDASYRMGVTYSF